MGRQARKNLYGLGVGLAKVGELGFKDALDTRREQGIEAMRQQLVREQMGQQERMHSETLGVEKQRLTEDAAYHKESLANQKFANESEADYRKRMAAVAERGDKTITIEVQQYGTDKDGKKTPLMGMDKEGNTVPLTRKVTMERQGDGSWAEINVTGLVKPKPGAPAAAPALTPVSAPPGTIPTTAAPAQASMAPAMPGLLEPQTPEAKRLRELAGQGISDLATGLFYGGQGSGKPTPSGRFQ